MFGEKELFKAVSKIKLADVLPNHNFPPGFDHAVIDEDNNILNFCSSRYSLVSNNDIFKPIENHFEKNNISYIRRINIINKSKFYIDYIIKERKDSGKIIGIFPKISVWNSYDGGSMMRHEMGFFRLVCSNGLTRPIGQAKKDIYRHATGEGDSMTTEQKVLQVVNDTIHFIHNASNDVAVFNSLAEQKATKKKVASIGKKVGLSKKIIECAEGRFDFEVAGNIQYRNEHGETVIDKGSERNMFTVYNALNYGIYNTNSKELPEKKVEKDRKLLLSILG